MNPGGPLNGLKVIELGDFISVGYAGKLLADLGADVIKVEHPESGDTIRRHGPFPGDIPDREKSGLHLFLNTNKRSITLNTSEREGREILLKLIPRVDLIISNMTLTRVEKEGLDYETLSRDNPSLILSSITVFGYDTPYRHWEGSALTATAASGISKKIGDPNKQPLWIPYCAADFQGGIHGAISALLALRMKRKTGSGQHAWVSVIEVMSSYVGGSGGLPAFVYQGNIGSRDGSHRSSFYPWQVVPAKDGYIEVITMVDKQWDRFIELMNNPEWSKDNRLDDRWKSFQWREDLDRYWHPWIKSRTRQELFEIFSENRLPFLPVYRIDEVAESSHLEKRSFWQTVSHPVMGTYKTMGPPYKLSNSPWSIRRSAPLLGQHNEEVYVEMLGMAEARFTCLESKKVI